MTASLTPLLTPCDAIDALHLGHPWHPPWPPGIPIVYSCEVWFGQVSTWLTILSSLKLEMLSLELQTSLLHSLPWNGVNCAYFRNVGQNGLNCPPKQNQLARPNGYVWKIEIALSLALKLVECQSGDGYRPPLTQTSSSDREGRARGGEDEILAGKIWTKLSKYMVIIMWYERL